MPDISIRRAERSDFKDINHLTDELGYHATLEQTECWLNLMLSSDAHEVFVAEIESVVGWISVEKRITLETGIKAEITGMVVDLAVRRKGLGRKLISKAEDWAKQQSLSRIVVRSDIKRDASHSFIKVPGLYIKRPPIIT